MTKIIKHTYSSAGPFDPEGGGGYLELNGWWNHESEEPIDPVADYFGSDSYDKGPAIAAFEEFEEALNYVADAYSGFHVEASSSPFTADELDGHGWLTVYLKDGGQGIPYGLDFGILGEGLSLTIGLHFDGDWTTHELGQVCEALGAYGYRA